MVFDISKPSRASEFKFETESLGKLQAKVLPFSKLSELTAIIKQKSSPKPIDTVKKLVLLIAYKTTTNENQITKVSSSDLKKLSTAELENFACSYIEKNPWLYDPLDESRQAQTSPKEKDESCIECLHRLILNYEEYKETQLRRLHEKLTNKKDWLSESSAKLLGQNLSISQSMGSILREMAPPQPPIDISKIVDNPIIRREQRIDNALTLFEKLQPIARESATFIKNINQLGLQLVDDFTTNIQRTNRHNKILISIGVLTLFFTATISLFNYLETKKSNKEIANIIDIFEKEVRASRDQNEATQALILDNLGKFENTQKQIHFMLDSLKNQTQRHPDSLDAIMEQK